MAKHTFEICLLAIFSLLTINEAAVSKHIRTLEFNDCAPDPKVIDWSKASTTQKNGVYTFKGTIEILEDIEGVSNASRQHYRFDQPNLSRPANWLPIGENFQLDICSILKGNDGDKHTIAFFKGFKPRMSCPLIKKGTYDVNSVIGDETDFLKFPVEGFKWKLVSKILAGPREVFCNEWIIKVDAQGSRKN